MRVLPGRCESSSLPRWLLWGLALLCLSPCSLLAHLELQEQTPKAGEKRNEPRKVIVRLVRRANQQPIAGATVLIASCCYPGGWWGDPPRGQRARLTDQQGRCLIEVPRDISGLVILSAKDGFGPASQSVRWKEDSGFLYLTKAGWTPQEFQPGLAPMVTRELEPGETIGGSVKDDQGLPIEGAEVTVVFDHHSDTPDADFLAPSNWSAHGNFAYVRVKTDAGGRWRCSSLPAAPRHNSALLLRVVHPDYVSDTGGFKRQLSLRTARAMTGVLVMKPGATVSGHIRDSEGMPVHGARVVLAYSNVGTDSLATRTDAAGRFVFAHADVHAQLWRWIVEVEAAGFAPASMVISPVPKPPPVELKLSRGHAFHGRIIDRKGRPVAGIEVRPRWDYFDHLDWQAVTDRDGRFTWPDAPREGDYSFDLHRGVLDVVAPVSAKTERADLTFDPDE
jgi:uncharacterized GH25 family protein